MGLFENKKGLILGIANDSSIASGDHRAAFGKRCQYMFTARRHGWIQFDHRTTGSRGKLDCVCIDYLDVVGRPTRQAADR